MKTGISTASLFPSEQTEDALALLSRNGVKNAEVFLESFCDYNEKFGKILSSVKGGTEIHSVHALTTQYEPQLYSVNGRAKADSFSILEGVMQAGEAVGAKYYTFHGLARLKKTAYVINYEKVAKDTREIMDVCERHGITLAYENVEWCYYNYIGFFDEVRKRVGGLKGTLDIKQARRSGIFYGDFIDEMKGDIVTVHLSDVNREGKMCLPGEGVTDFIDLFKRLRDVGFDGALLIEAYRNDYGEYKELFNSLEFVKEVADKVF